MGLVIARRKGERVVITTATGAKLYVMLVEIRSAGELGQVALDFEGDREEFTIHREEVQERVDRGQH